MGIEKRKKEERERERGGGTNGKLNGTEEMSIDSMLNYRLKIFNVI